MATAFGYGAVVLALVTALVGVLRYQNKQITDGKLVPTQTHERELAAAVTRGNEWKSAAEKAQESLQAEKDAHRQTRGLLAQSLEGNEIVKHFFSSYLPKHQLPEITESVS